MMCSGGSRVLYGIGVGQSKGGGTQSFDLLSSCGSQQWRFMRFSSSASTTTPGATTKEGEKDKRPPWQRWINFDSPFKSQSDELNRKRHYFWRVDAKGRLLRRELGTPALTSFGELRAPMIKDQLLAAVQRNRTGLYLSENCGPDSYPFLAMRLHEHNFMQPDDLSPIVFHDLVDASTKASICSNSSSSRSSSSSFELVFGSALRHPFRPDQLFLSPEGKLYHLFDRSSVIFDPDAYPTKSPYPITFAAATQPESPPIFGLIDSSLAQVILEKVEEPATSSASTPSLILLWRDGKRYPIQPLEATATTTTNSSTTAPAS